MNRPGTSSPHRRGSRAALLPLVVLATSFFVPAYRSCTDSPLQSPLQYAADGLPEALWVAPVFLVGGLLAALTAWALRRGAVGMRARRWALGAVALVALTNLAFGAPALAGERDAWPWLAGAVVAAVLAGAAVRRGRGRGPFEVWNHLLAAFACAAAGSAPALVMASDLGLDGARHLGPGAYLFLAAVAALLGLGAWATLRPGRTAAESWGW